jgi:hypothetical protein
MPDPRRTTKQELEQAQADAIRAALTARPGLTAYQLGWYVPTDLPAPDEQVPAGPADRPAPMVLTLRLLGQLEQAGKARSEPDPAGARWYWSSPARRGDS